MKMNPNESKPTKMTKANLGPMKDWLADGVPCYRVRFHQSVPTQTDGTPVGEFRIKVDNVLDRKYLVDRIYYTPHGVIFQAHGETNIIPLANVIYARTTG